MPRKATPIPTKTIRSEVISKVRLGDNREVRISSIETGLSEELIRIGINLLPGGDNLSGAVFPASYIDEVITALAEASPTEWWTEVEEENA